jgi:quinol monooxygenase YgiN
MRRTHMIASLLSAVCLAGLADPARGQTRPVLYNVVYLEVAPASHGAARSLLKEYRTATKGDGFNRLDVFEQIGRPGRFVVIENWRDQQSLDAHNGSREKTALLAMLKPLRTGAVDERPYRLASAGGDGFSTVPGAVFSISHVDTIPTPDTSGIGMLQRLGTATRAEPGLLQFEIAQHATRSNHFTVIGAWRDQTTAEAHTLAAHTKAFREELQAILGSPYDDRFYRKID